MDNRRRGIFRTLAIYAIIIAGILLVVTMTGTPSQMTEPEVLSYSQLLERIENDLKLSEGMEGASASGTVKSVLIQEDRLYGLKENSAIPDERFGNKYYDFASTLPSTEQFYKDVSAIYEAVLGRSVSPTGYRFTFSTQEAESPSVFLQLLPSIISILLFVGIMIFIMRMQSGANRGANNF
ncbi:MAG: hypothetical protein IKY06_07895, partial [Clostridia bacterium]|nr:hypothetical protein [Clostridia bacterium]